jgi:hypothetical protein
VCGLRMLAAKNSRKRIEARSPAAAMSSGSRLLWSGYLQHVRIHDASSGREMRNKGARRAP